MSWSPIAASSSLMSGAVPSVPASAISCASSSDSCEALSRMQSSSKVTSWPSRASTSRSATSFWGLPPPPLPPSSLPESLPHAATRSVPTASTPRRVFVIVVLPVVVGSSGNVAASTTEVEATEHRVDDFLGGAALAFRAGDEPGQIDVLQPVPDALLVELLPGGLHLGDERFDDLFVAGTAEQLAADRRAL